MRLGSADRCRNVNPNQFTARRGRLQLPGFGHASCWFASEPNGWIGACWARDFFLFPEQQPQGSDGVYLCHTTKPSSHPRAAGALDFGCHSPPISTEAGPAPKSVEPLQIDRADSFATFIVDSDFRREVRAAGNLPASLVDASYWYNMLYGLKNGGGGNCTRVPTDASLSSISCLRISVRNCVSCRRNLSDAAIPRRTLS